nr:RNA-directed DNA polymerase, eukaryota [Tanacetum cinerariifolium]
MNVWTYNTFKKISTKWGELLFEEDKDNMSLNSKRLCIKTKMEQNIFETCKFIVKGKVFWIRAKEVSGWVPCFLEEEDGVDASDNDTSDNEIVGEMNVDGMQDEANNEGDVDEVPETIFDKANEVSKEDNDKEIEEGEINYEDPFKIYDLLKKKPCENDKEVANSKETLEYPLDLHRDMIHVTKKTKTDFWMWRNRCRFRRTTCPPTGGSILMFCKHNSTISDYFVAIQGDWIQNAKKYLIISVYAPQDISEKRMLWSYLKHMIDSWSGETIIMGDFNEVRSKEERFGTIFNNYNASVFNSFISSGGLVEVPLGGCEFTWCHKSGSKMSKLDRFLISKDEEKVDQEIINKRIHVMNSLQDLEKLEASELAQKVKINWSIEGDENSRF